MLSEIDLGEATMTKEMQQTIITQLLAYKIDHLTPSMYL
jgi:hypothetical protein